MDSQTDSGIGTVSTESPSSSKSPLSCKSAESDSQQQSVNLTTFDELITSKSIDQFDPFGGGGQSGGGSLNSSWDTSYLQFPDNDPLLSSTIYDQNRAKPHFETTSTSTSMTHQRQDSIVRPSLGQNSDYIALPSRCTSTSSSVHNLIKVHRIVRVTYYFPPYQNDDDDDDQSTNSDEWTYFDTNGTQVDNPTLLGPKTDQPDLNDLVKLGIDFDAIIPSSSGLLYQKGTRVDNHTLLGQKTDQPDLIELTNLGIDFDMIIPSSSSGLFHQNGILLRTDSTSETNLQPMTQPLFDTEYALNNRMEPQLSLSDPKVISSPNHLQNPFQLELSSEPSNLMVNMFPAVPVTPKKCVNKPRRSSSQDAFPRKLWTLVNDPEFPQLNWSPDGNSIVFQPRLIEPVLTSFISSSKMAHFLRQLHMYRFRKANRFTKNRDRRNDVSEYHHKLFRRDHPELVDQIRGRFLKENKQVVDTNRSELVQ